MSDLTIVTELVVNCVSAATRALDDTLGSTADHPSLQIYIYLYISLICSLSPVRY
jgi:hypothetical protein